MFHYTLTRSKRKTVALYIRNGGLEVRAPLKMPKSEIDSFVASKEKWIADKLNKTTEQAARRENLNLNYGSSVAYRGKRYPIEEKEGNHIGFDGERFFMPPGLVPEQIKAFCIKIFRSLSKQYLAERTLVFARLMSVAPADIKITDARTRWGSCSAKKNINYSWRLIMADDEAIDYVIVHELAHLTEMNHSKRFWSIVESAMPDYRERRKKLKELQHWLSNKGSEI